MKRLKVGVIGCGTWGRNHVRVFSDLPVTEVIGVADTNPTTAKETGEKHRVKWYSDPTKLMNNPEIQLISICTPTVTHAEIALQAIECGKHVLVEKPMTNTVEEAKTLIKAAKKNGVHLTVGFVERFNPAVQEAYRRIAEGDRRRHPCTHPPRQPETTPHRRRRRHKRPRHPRHRHRPHPLQRAAQHRIRHRRQHRPPVRGLRQHQHRLPREPHSLHRGQLAHPKEGPTAQRHRHQGYNDS